MDVVDGTLVSLQYTLKDSEQNLVESNVDGDPLVYLHGASQIIPGLEKGLAGMKIGESKEIVVQPEHGYGAVEAEAIVDVPLEQIPEEARSVGKTLKTTTPDGHELSPIVVEVKEEVAVLDFNHPLAGKTLHFSVKVIDIQKADAPAE